MYIQQDHVMEQMANDPAPVFSHAEPVLAVKNVKETVAYWQDVLGFSRQVDHLASFYRQFGFIQACGMYREVGDL